MSQQYQILNDDVDSIIKRIDRAIAKYVDIPPEVDKLNPYLRLRDIIKRKPANKRQTTIPSSQAPIIKR